MGYIGVSPAAYASAPTKTALLYTADGGVDYSTHDALIGDGKMSDMRGMWLKNGILTSKDALYPLDASALGENVPCGVLHSKYTFCGSVLLHIGSCFYRVQDKNISVLSTSVPDAHSIPVEFGGELYLYVDTHIFKTDRFFVTKEVFPTPSVYMTACSDLSGNGIKNPDFKINMLAPYVAITYQYPLNPGNSHKNYYFPDDMDTTRSFALYFDGRLLDKSEYTVDGAKFRFNELEAETADTVKLCYYSVNAELDKSAELAGCTVGTSYGGGTLVGTRVFLSGNAAFPGKYYTGEISDPLAFYEDSGGTVGEAAGNITGFSKQQGYLLLFTDTTVNRISYQYTSEYGGYFTTKTIHSQIGCDMPRSIGICDNRTVFANSTGGVYLVDSTELYDGMNIIPISANITDASRNKGFFEVSRDALLAADSIVFDRKYVLHAGEKCFLWDFGAKSYSGSDYVGAAKKLTWFVFDDFDATMSLFTDGVCFYVFQKGDTTASLFALGGENAETPVQTTSFSLCSSAHDLGNAHTKKAVTGFAFECHAAEVLELAFDFLADGRRYQSIGVRVVPKADGYATCYVKLPSVTLRRFQFRMQGKGENIGIFNFRIDYKVLKEQYPR